MDRDENQRVTPSPTGGLRERSLAIVDRCRIRCGASRSQFAVFSLLTLVAATMWARPAGLLIWNRLRIITGMPRMAIANEDPKALAQSDMELPESLQGGRVVLLEDTLRRDPFAAVVRFDRDTMATGSRASASSSEVADASPASTERMLAAVSGMRLNGSGEGLTTAIVDGRARSVGQAFEFDGMWCRLVRVRSNAVVIEASLDGHSDWQGFLLERGGATPFRGE